MKELKKLSLKEEVDKEAKRIEKEVKSRQDLDDITVSEEMETCLFNKIQDYEYDKRSKTVYHKKKKRYVVLALAAVLVLVLGSAITSVGSKSYWKVLWGRIAGEEKLSYIDVEKMESQETEDLDEIYVYKQIGDELGISTVGLAYLPPKTYLKEYEIDKEQRKATLLYEYNGQVIRYMMYMNDEDSSLGQIKLDKLVDEYQLESIGEITVNVKAYEIEESKAIRYVGEFEYADTQYQIMGVIGKEEFDEIIKNLYLL